jgi:hypothetical protein
MKFVSTMPPAGRQVRTRPPGTIIVQRLQQGAGFCREQPADGRDRLRHARYFLKQHD